MSSLINNVQGERETSPIQRTTNFSQHSGRTFSQLSDGSSVKKIIIVTLFIFLILSTLILPAMGYTYLPRRQPEAPVSDPVVEDVPMSETIQEDAVIEQPTFIEHNTTTSPIEMPYANLLFVAVGALLACCLTGNNDEESLPREGWVFGGPQRQRDPEETRLYWRNRFEG